MAWRIFLHSLRQVFGNLEGALRVSALPMLALAAISLTMGRAMPADDATMQQMIEDGTLPWGLVALTVLASTVLWLWMVVAWHRYILLNERPALVPALRTDRMLGYLGRSLQIGLVLLVPTLLLGMLGGLAAVPLVQAGAHPVLVLLVTGVIVYVPLATLGLRLSAMLPGVALQAGVPLFTGWQATKGATGTILGVVVLSMIPALALDYLAQSLFADPLGLPATLASVLVQWVTALVGASVLTTLYGHYVEKRPLV